MPLFGATPGRGPPRNRPHFWYGKLVNVLWGAANLSDSTGTMYTQSASCGCISITKPKSEGTPRAMSCTNHPGYRNGIAPSGFARTIARAEIHGAQSYARTVRTLDISLAGTSRCTPLLRACHVVPPSLGAVKNLRQTQPRTCGLCWTDPAELCVESTRHWPASNVADADDRTTRGPVT